MTGRYRPYLPAARPGSSPPGDKPPYRVLVHRQFEDAWDELPARVGLESAQQFYDHVAHTPGQIPRVNSSGFLKGEAGKAKEGFSRVVRYEISGAGRIHYRYKDDYQVDPDSDPHPVVQIMTIDLGSH